MVALVLAQVNGPSLAKLIEGTAVLDVTVVLAVEVHPFAELVKVTE
jgi:hypothetical protein